MKHSSDIVKHHETSQRVPFDAMTSAPLWKLVTGTYLWIYPNIAIADITRKYMRSPIWIFLFRIKLASLTYLHGEWQISHYAVNI